MSQLTTNTTTIDELITMANSLPDVGSGGGSEVETCTITINKSGSACQMTYLTINGTEIIPASITWAYGESKVINNVVGNSIITILVDMNSNTIASSGDATVINTIMTETYKMLFIIACGSGPISFNIFEL